MTHPDNGQHNRHDGGRHGAGHHEGGCGCGCDHHHPHEHHESDHVCGCAQHAEGSAQAAPTDDTGDDGGGESDDDDPRLSAAPAASDSFAHTHGHHHDDHHHDHGHSHGVPAGHDGERRVLWVLILTGGFMLAEVAGGLLSGSLAMLADAGHMLTDSASLLLAWTAFRLARRPPTERHSYGWRRFEVLAAYTNGIVLFILAAWIVVEASQRLMDPQPVLSGPMLVIAALGLAVNLAGFLILNGGAKSNLNLRGAWLHVTLQISWVRWPPSPPPASSCTPGGPPPTPFCRYSWPFSCCAAL